MNLQHWQPVQKRYAELLLPYNIRKIMEDDDIVEWKFGEGPIKTDGLFKRVEVDGEKLTLHLVGGAVIEINDYYKKVDKTKGASIAEDRPKVTYDKKQIEAIMDQIELVMAKNYREYSQELHEPLLSNMIALERYAMTLEMIGMRYDAAYNYQYMADDLLCARAGVGIATKFVKKAQELNDEWKMDNGVNRTGVDEQVRYFIDVFGALSKIDPKALKEMDEELRGYDAYKIYPEDIPLLDVSSGTMRISTDPDDVRKHYDKFFDLLLSDEYVAMAKVWVATHLEAGDDVSMLSGISEHVRCCLRLFELEKLYRQNTEAENLNVNASIIPAKYLDMARAVFQNAQKAFDIWTPSQQAIDDGSYQSIGNGLIKLKNALYE